MSTSVAKLDFETGYVNISTTGGWHTGFAQVIQATTYATEQDYRNLLKRLAAFDDYARQNIELMRRAMRTGYTLPCESLQGYEQTITGYIAATPKESVFAIPFDPMPASIPEATRHALRSEALRIVEDIINPAYQAFAEFYSGEYAPACRPQIGLSSLPAGRDAYAQALRYYTSLDTDADAVHALGLSEVRRIRSQMEDIIEEVEFDGTFAEFLGFLKTDPQFYAKDEQSYLHHAAWIAKSIDSRLPRYFAKLPRNPYGISVIPNQIAPKATTAFYRPGAADGSRSGQYFLNTYNLASRPLYELPALTLHESVPGHHLQLSFQAENEHLPDWRRFYYFQAYGEGWGLYSEFLGEEMGVYTTPYERFGRLIYEMWRAVRLVVDTGIHAFEWSRDDAIAYMLENTGLTETNVIAEVDRYITTPGQATAYKYGELKIKELRRRAENALGQAFDLREFHLHLVSSRIHAADAARSAGTRLGEFAGAVNLRREAIMPAVSAGEAWLEFEGSHSAHATSRLTLGHIHETHVIESENGPLAVLQRINRQVVSRPRNTDRQRRMHRTLLDGFACGLDRTANSHAHREILFRRCAGRVLAGIRVPAAKPQFELARVGISMLFGGQCVRALSGGA